MKLTYLGHAGFCVETEKAIVIMDPWLSPSGAFDSAWFQFPCNHHLASFVQEKLRDSQKSHYIYISHEHKDHFDITFLSSLQSSNFTFVIPHFRRTELYDRLQHIPCKSIMRCRDGQPVKIPGAELTLYLDDSELDRDSAILIRADGQSFLNLNDCKIHDRLSEVLETGPIDVFTAQFSGAVWHPICYNYPKKRYEAVSTKKMFSKFEVIAKALTVIQPKLYLTSAGPACFLDPILLDKNFERVNIFPRASKLFTYLKKRLKGVTPNWQEPMPGDRYDIATGQRIYAASEHVNDANFEEYVRSYAARFHPLFEARRRPTKENTIQRTLERLTTALQEKLAALALRDRIKIPLYFQLIEAPNKLIRVDFQANQITISPAIIEKNFYSISAHTSDVARVLDGYMNWEDFMLSFRMKLNRDPDIYHTVIHGFLVMQVEDMNWFCSKVLDAESNTERTLIEAAGKQYSINRYCPHQGADLSHGWIEQGRYLVCPRHRWKYDLEAGGTCTDCDVSIRAFEVAEP